MGSDDSPSTARWQVWAYRSFLVAQAGLLIGLLLVPLLFPFESGVWLWGWFWIVLPWSPGFGSAIDGIPFWITVWGFATLGLFLSGLIASGFAAGLELRSIRAKDAGSVKLAERYAPHLEERSYRTLRAFRSWLVIEGVLAYGVGLYLLLGIQSYGRYFNPWPTASVPLFIGLFLFFLSLVPAYFLSVDARRSPSRPRRRTASFWFEFNSP